jgi:hypothetical protein
MKRKIRTILEAGSNDGLEIYTGKTKSMILSHHPNSGQNKNVGTSNVSIKNVTNSNICGQNYEI